MNIAVIGAGNMGAAIGRHWAHAGHQITFSFSRDPQALKALAASVPNGRSGSVEEAVAAAEAVLLAVPYPALKDALQSPAQFQGKLVISCVSGLMPDFTGNTIGIATQRQISVAEEIAGLLPGAHVFEAFNTTFAEVIAAPERNQNQVLSLFFCGDEPSARVIVAQLIADCGYRPIDAGGLRVARVLETLATAWVQFASGSGLFPMIGLNVLRGNEIG